MGSRCSGVHVPKLLESANSPAATFNTGEGRTVVSAPSNFAVSWHGGILLPLVSIRAPFLTGFSTDF